MVTYPFTSLSSVKLYGSKDPGKAPTTTQNKQQWNITMPNRLSSKLSTERDLEHGLKNPSNKTSFPLPLKINREKRIVCKRSFVHQHGMQGFNLTSTVVIFLPPLLLRIAWFLLSVENRVVFTPKMAWLKKNAENLVLGKRWTIPCTKPNQVTFTVLASFYQNVLIDISVIKEKHLIPIVGTSSTSGGTVLLATFLNTLIYIT